MSDPVEVLDYWLGLVGPEGWYKGGEDLDAEIRALWSDLWQAARDGGLDHWVDGTVGTLAFLVLTDQFPRNMHRGSALAFATDAQARAAAHHAIDQGWDMGAPEPERQFFYLPLEHSEDMADQDLCVRLMTERLASEPDNILHARAHRAIIAQFGRFPFRNAALGRQNTPAEDDFMAQGAYMGFVNRLRAAEGA